MLQRAMGVHRFLQKESVKEKILSDNKIRLIYKKHLSIPIFFWRGRSMEDAIKTFEIVTINGK